MSVNLGEASVYLDLDDSGFQAGLARNEGAFRSSLGRMESEGNRSIAALGAGLTRTGAMLTAGITVPVAGVGLAAVKLAAGYEQTMNVVQATTQASAAEMAKLGDQAEALGADMQLPGTSAKDAAEGMLELAKAGLSVNDIMGASRGVMQLAAAGQLSNADAALVTATNLNAFGLAGSEATRVADLLAGAANSSSANIRDLALGLSMSSAVYAAAGFEIDELATALALMSNNGLRGSDAGTSLKTALLALQTPTDKQAKLMDELGLHVYDAGGNMLSMREIIGNLTTSTAGLTQEQRDNALGIIFGSDAVRAANILIREGVEGYDAMHASVTEAGAAQKFAEAQTKGLAGAWDGLKSTAEGFLIDAAQPLLGTLEGLVRSGAGLIDWVSGLNKNILIGAGAFAGFLAVIGPVAVGLGLILTIANPLTLTLGAIAVAAAGLGAAAVLVYQNWDKVTETFPEIGQLVNWLTDRFQDAKVLIGGAMEGIATIVVGAGNVIIGQLQAQFSLLGGIVRTAVAVINRDFSSIDDIFSETVDGIQRGSQRVLAGYSTMASGVIEMTAGMIDAWRDWRREFDGIVSDVSKGYSEQTVAQAAALLKQANGLDDYRQVLISWAKHHGRTADAIALQYGYMGDAQADFTALFITSLEMISREQAKADRDSASRAAGITQWLRTQRGAYEETEDTIYSYIDALRDQQEMQSLVDANVSQAAANIGYWEDNLSETERALDILNKQIESGIPLSEEQQKQYDTLTWGAERLKGGIEDQEQAYVAAVVAQNEFMQLQDRLNEALANGEISQDEYNQQIADARSEMNSALGPTGELTNSQQILADTVGKVVDKLRDLLVDLGLIPAEVSTDVIQRGAEENRKRIHDMNMEIDAVPETVTTTASVETSDANTAVDELQSNIDDVPDGFTVTANVNIAPAMEQIALLRGAMPSSPAKWGPLSTLPNWDALFAGLPIAARERTLQVSQILGEMFSSPAGPSLADLLLAQVTAGVSASQPAYTASGTEIAQAIIDGFAAGTPQAIAAVGEMSAEVLSALAKMQAEAQSKLDLAIMAGASDEDIAELQAALDKINAVIAAWGEQSGITTSEAIDAAGVGPALVAAWMEALDNLDDILSGEYQARLQERLTSLRNQLMVAMASEGVPPEVIAALEQQIAELEAALEQAGVILETAIDTGVIDPITERWNEAIDGWADLFSGDGLTRLQDAVEEAGRNLAFAEALGLPPEVIEQLRSEYMAAQIELAKLLDQMRVAYEAGLLDDEAKAAYEEAAGVIVESLFPVDQLLALAGQMTDGGEVLLEEFLAAVAEGGAEYADLLALLEQITAANVESMEGDWQAGVDATIESLERLEEELLKDLAQAYIDGTDPTAILANLEIVQQALADTAAQAEQLIDPLTQLGNLSAGPGLGNLSVGGTRGVTALNDAAEELGESASDLSQAIDRVTSELPATIDRISNTQFGIQDPLRYSDPAAYAARHGGVLLSSGLVGFLAQPERQDQFWRNMRFDPNINVHVRVQMDSKDIAAAVGERVVLYSTTPAVQ